MSVGALSTLRCLGEEQLEIGKTRYFLSGHGNHSLKPEEGEEQGEPLNATLLLPSSTPRHPCSLPSRVSAQVLILGACVSKLLRTTPAFT